MASKLRIAKWEMVLMVVVALIIDAIDLLLEFVAVGVIADTILGVGAWLLYYIWFKVRGVKFGSRSAMRMGVTTVAELIPIVNALPAWTAGIIWTLSAVIAEDELGITIPGSGGAGNAVKGATAIKDAPIRTHPPIERNLTTKEKVSLAHRARNKNPTDDADSNNRPNNVRKVQFDGEDEMDEEEDESLAA